MTGKPRTNGAPLRLTVHTSECCLALKSVVVAGQDATLVVDPGWSPAELDRLRSIAEATPAGHATHILFTHADVDHVVGWKSFGPSTLLAHPAAAGRNPAEQEAVVAQIDERRGFVRTQPYRYPPAHAITPAPEKLNLGGVTALFFPAPGHAPDGLLTVLPEYGTLIAGDYLIDAEGPYILHSWQAFRQSLRLIRSLCDQFGIERLIPGHGEVAESRTEIENRLAVDLDYLDRLADAVVEARAQGLTPDEAAQRLSGFEYRGAPVGDHWSDAHAANIRLLYAEAGDR